MALQNVLNVLKNKVRIVKDPTNLAAAFPYGGTELGLCRDVEAAIDFRVKNITAEEWGGTTTEAIYVGEGIVITGVLRTFDNDLYASVFPYTTDGATKKVAHQDVAGVETARAGSTLGARGMVLLLAPKDATRNPAILLYRALPALQAAARLAMALNTEYGVPFAFHGTPDSSNRVYASGLLSDLSL